MQAVELRQHDHALLIVRIGAGDDGDAGLVRAQIVGELGQSGGDVEEIAGAGDPAVEGGDRVDL